MEPETMAMAEELPTMDAMSSPNPGRSFRAGGNAGQEADMAGTDASR